MDQKCSFATQDRAAKQRELRSTIVSDLQRRQDAVTTAYIASKSLYEIGEQMDKEIYDIAEKHGIDENEYRYGVVENEAELREETEET
jgi:hypothetical protein